MALFGQTATRDEIAQALIKTYGSDLEKVDFNSLLAHLEEDPTRFATVLYVERSGTDVCSCYTSVIESRNDDSIYAELGKATWDIFLKETDGDVLLVLAMLCSTAVNIYEEDADGNEGLPNDRKRRLQLTVTYNALAHWAEPFNFVFFHVVYSDVGERPNVKIERTYVAQQSSH